MYDIYATDFIFEKCARDKEKIHVVAPYTVFHFVLAGEGYVNGKKVTENNVFIAFENTVMEYYPSKSKPWSYIYIRLNGDDMKNAFLRFGFDMDSVTVLPFHKQETLFKILSLHQDLETLNDLDAKKAIANAVLLLFKKVENNEQTTNRQLQHAEKIKRYIDENFYKKITIASIATKFFLNKNYVRTLFARYFGTSPKAYLQNLRMIRAKFLLSSTNEDIRLIASSVGYDDPLLFSKIFKRYFQVSPKQYRAEHKETSVAT